MQRSRKAEIMKSALVLLTVVLLGGCSVDEETPIRVADADNAAPSGASKPKEFKTGDIVQLGDFQVVVHGVQNPLPPASEFLKPAAGSHWIGLDIEVKNTSAAAALFSILLGAELQDSENKTYAVELTDHSPKAPDGEIPPASGKRGLLVFEVPDMASGFRLLFKGDMFSTGTAVIVL